MTGWPTHCLAALRSAPQALDGSHLPSPSHECRLIPEEQFALLENHPDAVKAVGIVHGAVMAKLSRGVGSANDDAIRETREAERIALDCGDDIALSVAQLSRGLVLSGRCDASERVAGTEMLQRARRAQKQGGMLLSIASMGEVAVVRAGADAGDLDEAIEVGRALVVHLEAHGEMMSLSAAVAALVEVLVHRGSTADIAEAEDRIARLAAVTVDPGFVLNDIWLLRMRALLAEATGDEAAYRECAERYRAMASSLEFEGHMAWADAMCQRANINARLTS